jgi:hypothetical protein
MPIDEVERGQPRENSLPEIAPTIDLVERI